MPGQRHVFMNVMVLVGALILVTLLALALAYRRRRARDHQLKPGHVVIARNLVASRRR